MHRSKVCQVSFLGNFFKTYLYPIAHSTPRTISVKSRGRVWYLFWILCKRHAISRRTLKEKIHLCMGSARTARASCTAGVDQTTGTDFSQFSSAHLLMCMVDSQRVLVSLSIRTPALFDWGPLPLWPHLTLFTPLEVLSPNAVPLAISPLV